MQNKWPKPALLSLHCSVAVFVLGNFYAGGVTAEGHDSGVCVSPGGHFPRFSFEGQPPRKSSKGSNDLTLCRIFRKKTCCTAAQTHPALISVRRLASHGEATPECLALWELLECSICDPLVGTRPGPPVICRHFCDSVFEACSEAFFAVDPTTRVLAACGPRDTLCGKGSRWASNGSEFCQLAGFSVLVDMDSSRGIENSFCFDGRTSIGAISDVQERASQVGSSQKMWGPSLLQEFYQWVRGMDVSERVSWAVGGMVLTAGVIFIRSLPVMPGLWLLSVALSGARVKGNGNLSVPIGLHAGLIAGNFIIHAGGFIRYNSNAPAWITGSYAGHPLAGALGLSLVATLAILLYPWEIIRRHRSMDFNKEASSF